MAFEGKHTKQDKSSTGGLPLSKLSNKASSHSTLQRHFSMICQPPFPTQNKIQFKRKVAGIYNRKHQVAQEIRVTLCYKNLPASSTRFQLDLTQNEASVTFLKLSHPCQWNFVIRACSSDSKQGFPVLDKNHKLLFNSFKSTGDLDIHLKLRPYSKSWKKDHSQERKEAVIFLIFLAPTKMNAHWHLNTVTFFK